MILWDLIERTRRMKSWRDVTEERICIFNVCRDHTQP